MEDEVIFRGGPNIAIKIPKRKYEQTIAFYRNVLKMEVEESPINHPTISRTHRLQFGENILWLDCVDNYSRSEIWLELTVNHVDGATNYLRSNGVETCDELEELSNNMHWITDPAGNVFLVCENQ
ncbi:MAG TPA: VOC family protein [Saprospiraceae bacterium]|nr:VOC family protein [Saprospiraceae bacterium]